MDNRPSTPGKEKGKGPSAVDLTYVVETQKKKWEGCTNVEGLRIPIRGPVGTKLSFLHHSDELLNLRFSGDRQDGVGLGLSVEFLYPLNVSFVVIQKQQQQQTKVPNQQEVLIQGLSYPKRKGKKRRKERKNKRKKEPFLIIMGEEGALTQYFR